MKDKSTCDKILDAAKNLAHTKWDKISVAPDLTLKQRNDDNDLRQEAARRNEEMDPEEALNYNKIDAYSGQSVAVLHREVRLG